MPTRRLRSALVAALVVAALATATAEDARAADGTMTWGVHVSLTPAFFDPADATGTALPLMVYYGVHDALVRPMPGTPMGNALAQSWSMSKDGLVYEFVLRRGVKFHNGDVMTAEDVKFSFERYRGASAALLKQKVAAVEIPDPSRVRFRLKEPWPDFMTFYATPATGAAWIVPKKYVEKVGDEGFKKQPVGAGPYRFVSFKPGVELVLEAHEGYWRKPPVIKTLVFKVIPDDATRLAALKRGEVDVAYGLTGPLAEEVRRTAGFTLKSATIPVALYLVFADQDNREVAVARPPGAPGRQPRHRPPGASTRRATSAWAGSPRASSPRRWSSTGSRRSTRTIPGARASSSPRRAMPAASTRAS